MTILEILSKKTEELTLAVVCEQLKITPKVYAKYFYKGTRAKPPAKTVLKRIKELWNVEELTGHELGLKPLPEPRNPVLAQIQAMPVNAPKVEVKPLSEVMGQVEVKEDEPEAKPAEVETGALDISLDIPKEQANWENRDVCLCIPCYGPVPYQFFASCLALVMKYRDQLRFEGRGDDSMIARSRNQLAKRFLDTKASWSIWLDSDMVFPFGVAGPYMTMTGMNNLAHEFLSVHTIDRLISHKKTIVGGCYWDRRGGGKLIAGGDKPIWNPIPSNSLTAIGFVGTGCLAIHRQVFLDIAEKFPETFSSESYGNECGFFTPIQTPHRMMGEDESFAKRATDAGHPSWLDLGLICGHVGSVVHGIPAGGSKI